MGCALAVLGMGRPAILRVLIRPCVYPTRSAMPLPEHYDDFDPEAHDLEMERLQALVHKHWLEDLLRNPESEAGAAGGADGDAPRCGAGAVRGAAGVLRRIPGASRAGAGRDGVEPAAVGAAGLGRPAVEGEPRLGLRSEDDELDGVADAARGEVDGEEVGEAGVGLDEGALEAE